MKIKIYSISKKVNDDYEKIIDSFIGMSAKWAKLENNNIFTKDITKAQNIGDIEAKESYTKEFDKYLGSYNIVLHPKGKLVDTEEFSKLLTDKLEVNFFVGGAYGFENNFLNSCQKSISLSNLTFSHKIAKTVLFEQIYRALSLMNNHPYHKM